MIIFLLFSFFKKKTISFAFNLKTVEIKNKIKKGKKIHSKFMVL
jgi:hypothetical protein